MKFFRDIFRKIKKSYLHLKWQRRYDNAWINACYKSYKEFGNESWHDLSYYFSKELSKLKKK